MRIGRVSLFAAPGLVLAVAGLWHPERLTFSTADTWTLLHVLLLPVFPLLGLLVWWLLRDDRGPVAWAAKIAAFGFAAFYTALDVLAGIATGTITRDASERDVAMPGEEIDALFAAGNALGEVGGWFFIAACALASLALFLRVGQRVLPGAVLLVGGAYVFSGAHIYWPEGGLSMLALAAGFVLLALAPRAETLMPAPSEAAAATG